jgi:NADPH:quinone reductase-like Zn-dependent oxidoreductase
VDVVKASYIMTTGPASEITWGELPDPLPGPGQVLVRPEAVAVDHVDLLTRSGRWQTTLRFPQVVGRDLVGTVVRAGDEAADTFRPGDRVWTNSAGYGGRAGATAELVVVDQDRLYPLPEGASAHEFVAVLHAGATAFGLLERAGVREGETVAVTGANGAVGVALVQAASRLGADVVAVCRTEQATGALRRRGARTVVVADGDHAADAAFDASPEGVDLFVEVSGHTALEPVVRRLNRRGRLALLSSRRPFDFEPWTFYTRELTLVGFVMSGMTSDELARAARSINAAYVAGFRVPVAQPMTFADARSAHERLEAGGPGRNEDGLVPRIVLTPTPGCGCALPPS